MPSTPCPTGAEVFAVVGIDATVKSLVRLIATRMMTQHDTSVAQGVRRDVVACVHHVTPLLLLLASLSGQVHCGVGV
jgi:hypothetical protein